MNRSMSAPKLSRQNQSPVTAQLSRRQGKRTKRKRQPRSSKRKGRGGGLGSSPQPSSKVVRLTFVTRIGLATGGASQFYAYPLLTNGAFAPDQAGAPPYSTTPGFSSLSALYSKYRVTKYHYKVMFTNESGGETQVFVCNSNSALGAAAGGSTGVDLTQFVALRKGFNKTKALAASSGGPAVGIISGTHTIKSVYGDSPFSDPGFKAATNAVPTNQTFLVMGIATSAVANTVLADVQIDMEVEFLDYIDTITSLGEDSQPRCFSSSPVNFLCAACDRLKNPWPGDHDDDPWESCVCGKKFECKNCHSILPCGSWYRVPDCTRPPDPTMPVYPRVFSRKDSDKAIRPIGKM